VTTCYLPTPFVKAATPHPVFSPDTVVALEPLQPWKLRDQSVISYPHRGSKLAIQTPMRLSKWTVLLMEAVFSCPALPNEYDSQLLLKLGTAMHSRPRVKLDTGTIEGNTPVDDIRSFKGIPYASPPVKQLRWRPPQPVASWNRTRSAYAYGPSCMQFLPPGNSLYYGGETTLSEDCLYLNVWTGASLEEAHNRRPVLVILHFGAFQFGSASNPIYDGEAMARRGLVVVSANYRLGRIGFIAHPELTFESGTNSSGNYGHMDQIAALQWVQRNIAAFGGDPDNVTLMGVSAGAHSIYNLRCSPLAKDLFHKCIVASGPGFAHAMQGYGHPANPSTLAAGEAAGVEVATLLGATTMNELRTFPAEEVLAVQLPRASGEWSFDLLPEGAKISLHAFDASYPVVDGSVMTQAPLDALLTKGNDNIIDVPMLASNTGNEASGLPYLASLDVYRTYIKETFSELAKEALRLYPAGNDAEAQIASRQLLADQVFNWSTWTAARLQARRLSSKVWYARFMRKPMIPADSNIIERDHASAFHGADVMYALGNLEARAWNWTDEDKQLSHEMVDAWVRFAYTGDPTGFGNVSWSALNKNFNGPVKTWDVAPRLDENRPFLERMAFWDRINGVADSLQEEADLELATRD
jgi:para-nitrobenzyl esterase